MIGLCSKGSVLPENIEQEGVNIFNDYFSNIEPLLAAQLSHVPYLSSLMPLTNSFVRKDIKASEIISTLGNNNQNKTTGLGTNHVKLIKYNIDILGVHLLRSF